jgi:uncharacterized protein
MRNLLIALFLLIVLGLFSTKLQARFRAIFARRPAAVWLIPSGLTLLFAAVLVASRAWSAAFVGLVAVYTFLPTALVYRSGPGGCRKPFWLDFAAILLLWLPLEFAVGRALLPPTAWTVANTTARGVSITLALSLFLLFRDLKAMKYTLPRKWTDLAYPAIAFIVLAPVLIALGLWLGHMGPARVWPSGPAGFALLWLKIVLAVAIPEELLFRALIQNWLMQRFGFSHRTLLAAALIFGASHLNNPPGPLPNWRYMLLATIAGFVFGKVFWKATSILSSASLHALINSVRHAFFL